MGRAAPAQQPLSPLPTVSLSRTAAVQTPTLPFQRSAWGKAECLTIGQSDLQKA